MYVEQIAAPLARAYVFDGVDPRLCAEGVRRLYRLFEPHETEYLSAEQYFAAAALSRPYARLFIVEEDPTAEQLIRARQVPYTKDNGTLTILTSNWRALTTKSGVNWVRTEYSQTEAGRQRYVDTCASLYGGAPSLELSVFPEEQRDAFAQPARVTMLFGLMRGEREASRYIVPETAEAGLHTLSELQKHTLMAGYVNTMMRFGDTAYSLSKRLDMDTKTVGYYLPVAKNFGAATVETRLSLINEVASKLTSDAVAKMWLLYLIREW